MEKELILKLKESVRTQILITKTYIDMFLIINEDPHVVLLETQKDHYLILDELRELSPSRNNIMLISKRISNRIKSWSPPCV